MPAEANWAGNLTYRAAAVHHPATHVAQVQDLVARLPRVRALGTRHSFSAVADRPGRRPRVRWPRCRPRSRSTPPR